MKTFSAAIPINESSLARVWQQAQDHDVGTISGYRHAEDCGEGRLYTTSEKNNRNAVLRSKLLMAQYGVTSIKGVYIENYGTPDAKEVHEESYLVVDLKNTGRLKDDLMTLGRLFEQDSITYQKAGTNDYYLISTNTCLQGYPGRGRIGVQLKLGSAMFGKGGEFFSRVNGRPFVFESARNDRIDLLHQYPPTEIRGIVALAESM